MIATRWIAAVFFAGWQNIYFGWHAFPQSDAELIADGISVLLFSLALQQNPVHSSNQTGSA